ncbi:hypothetical protein ACTHAM_002406 [Cellulomonas soli]|uniref:hypothetical protein n=1 Tax=Cellulomonas soli TaxID=931535 RepID=UPI003F82BD18
MVSANPTYLSAIPPGTDLSVLETGARVLQFDVHEQNRLLGGVLEARDEDELPLYPIVVVLQPRRSAKTTGIWEVLIGRCLDRPGTVVLATAQDGTRARDRLKDQMRRLRGHGFRDATQKPGDDEGELLGLLYWGNGDERIEFTNGSRLVTAPPVASAIRGEAADVLFFDEAGELDLAKSEDLLSGALPLLDTRPMGQAIIAGTPAKERAGLFWDTLQEGRAGEPGTGIVDYSVRDDEDVVIDEQAAIDEGADLPTEWARKKLADGTVVVLNEDVLRRVHPGIGTLTTIAKMRQRFTKMQVAQFEMEYLCRFPFSSDSRAIDPEKWASCASDVLKRPERVGIAFNVARDSTSSSIAYAWRLPDGRAVVELADHRPGTSWLANTAHRASKTHPQCPIAYDQIGANLDPAAALDRMKPKPRQVPLSIAVQIAATQRFMSELRDGRLVHFEGQVDLDLAVENTTWREAGRSGRAFGVRDHSAAAINPLVACVLALWQYDKQGERRSMTLVA